ncbi:MAG: cytochrome d ubiquinol oxidase subunit II [Nannocystis sp.]|nr:cytochrome d ubiquinol oxidase subunit II [Nannocystis sp.]
MTPELLVAGVMALALIIYTLSAGADFGSGVWELLARGELGARKKAIIHRAIGPIWEANHVWLILIVVLLFVCFPAAHAAVTTALHVPLTLMLIGVVLRGSAYVFRAYDVDPGGPGARGWGRVFAISSLVTPITLGVVLGALSDGIERDPASGRVVTDFVSAWLRPYPIAVGVFALALFAFLAAIYLVHEAGDDEPAVKASFRADARAAGLAVGGAALVAFLVADEGAPRLYASLAGAAWAPALHVCTGIAALLALAANERRRDQAARAAAIVQAALIVSGWALAQYPYLAAPGYAIAESAAPTVVLWPVLGALAAGALLLVPALGYLFLTFKRRGGHDEAGAPAVTSGARDVGSSGRG